MMASMPAAHEDAHRPSISVTRLPATRPRHRNARMALSRGISFGAALVLAASGLLSASPSMAGTTAARAGLIQSWGTTTTDLSGSGYPNERHTPAAVALPGGVRATAIAAGATNFVAIGSDHYLYAWGMNSHGETGDGTTTERPKPVRVKLPAGVK